MLLTRKKKNPSRVKLLSPSRQKNLKRKMKMVQNLVKKKKRHILKLKVIMPRKILQHRYNNLQELLLICLQQGNATTKEEKVPEVIVVKLKITEGYSVANVLSANDVDEAKSVYVPNVNFWLMNGNLDWKDLIVRKNLLMSGM